MRPHRRLDSPVQRVIAVERHPRKQVVDQRPAARSGPADRPRAGDAADREPDAGAAAGAGAGLRAGPAVQRRDLRHLGLRDADQPQPARGGPQRAALLAAEHRLLPAVRVLRSGRVRRPRRPGQHSAASAPVPARTRHRYGGQPAARAGPVRRARSGAGSISRPASTASGRAEIAATTEARRASGRCAARSPRCRRAPGAPPSPNRSGTAPAGSDSCRRCPGSRTGR